MCVNLESQHALFLLGHHLLVYAVTVTTRGQGGGGIVDVLQDAMGYERRREGKEGRKLRKGRRLREERERGKMVRK